MTDVWSGITTAHLTADLVLTADVDNVKYVLVIKRGSEPFKEHDAIPGGYLDEGETFEQAARRELSEETSVQAPPLLREVGMYDAPDRDPRGRVITMAYTAHLDHMPEPTARDDARDARWVPVADVPALRLAFDHAEILRDALAGAR